MDRKSLKDSWGGTWSRKYTGLLRHPLYPNSNKLLNLLTCLYLALNRFWCVDQFIYSKPRDSRFDGGSGGSGGGSSQRPQS